MTTAPIISVQHLTTAFGTHVVHQDLSLDIYPKEILALVGGSGLVRPPYCDRFWGSIIREVVS